MTHLRWSLGVCLLVAMLAAPGAADVTIESFDPIPGDLQLQLGTYQHPAGGNVLNLTVGIGSSLFRGPLDLFNTFWTVSDRGPNIACEDAPLVLNLTPQVACPADVAKGVPAGAGRIYPRPDYSPSIYHIRLNTRTDTFHILDVIPLRGRTGTPFTGLPNPTTTATTEFGRNGNAEVLPRDVNAVDAEALVRIPLIGRFFIGEENGTSLIEVARDGRVLKRFVPAGTESDYTNPPSPLAPADYAVVGSLPALLAKRRLNRGIESLAISRDFKHLYFLMQSPLNHPDDANASRNSRNLRLFKAKLDLGLHSSNITVVGEFVYQEIPVAEFVAKTGVTDAGPQRDLRVSEMVNIGHERFLVIERTDQATIVFEIDLHGATNILGSKWDDPATDPALERTVDLAAAGIVPVQKTERFIASSLATATPQFPPKLEGIALTHDGRVVIINDDDFGITGLDTQINIVNED